MSSIDSPVFVVETLIEENYHEIFKEGQIVRIENICPATDSLQKLKI